MIKLLECIHQFDVSAFSWCLRRKYRKQIVNVSKVVSYTANGPLYAFAAVFFAFVEQWPLVLLLAAAFAIERVIYFALKTFFKRNRPPEAIPGFYSAITPSDKFSFPSGHTSAAFLVTCAIVSVYPLTAFFLYPWAACVGIARVMLGVHFPTDVLAGALMGHTICVILIQLML